MNGDIGAIVADPAVSNLRSVSAFKKADSIPQVDYGPARPHPGAIRGSSGGGYDRRRRAYDLELEFTPEDYQAMLIHSAVAAGATPPEALKLMESSGDSLLRSLGNAGLKLEPRKAPLDAVVIDHMSKTPTEN